MTFFSCIGQYVHTHKNIWLLFIIISILALFIYFCCGNSQCKKLRKHGFSYSFSGGDSPTWDSIMFYFFKNTETTNLGPEISGSCLQVSCHDVDNDGFAEFIIQSQVTRTYKTILKVDIHSGKYHVLYTEGLKVHYPQEGYFYQ